MTSVPDAPRNLQLPDPSDGSALALPGSDLFETVRRKLIDDPGLAW